MQRVFESLIAHHRFVNGAMKAPFLFEMLAVEGRGVEGRPGLRGILACGSFLTCGGDGTK